MNRSIHPPPPQHSFPTSEGRLCSTAAATSILIMDPHDVVEIPPPIINAPNSINHKQPILHEVIDVDNDDDTEDLVLIGEKGGKSDKGKAKESIGGGYDHQNVEVYGNIICPSAMDNSGSGSMVESSNGYTTASHHLINIDEHDLDSSDNSCDFDDDDYSDLFSDEYMDVDQYALLQTHFDNVDIPPGIEAPIPWLEDYDLGSNKTDLSHTHWSPWPHSHSDANISLVTDSFQPSLPLEPTNPEIQGPHAGSSSLQIKMDAVINHPSGIELSSAQVLSKNALSKKKSNASQHRRRKLKLAFGMGSAKSNFSSGTSEIKKKPIAFSTSANHGFVDNLEAKKLPYVGEGEAQPLHWAHYENSKNPAGIHSSFHSKPNFVGPPLHFPGVVINDQWFKNTFHLQPIPTYTAHFQSFDPFAPPHTPPVQMFDNSWVQNSVSDENNGTTANSTVATISDEARDAILTKFQNFKQFDTIEDASDHFFFHYNTSMKQRSKNWAKRIQEEWKSLEKDLPDSIFVRLYESRIDILRAVIIGAEGTPYHDGLFFFDVYFPSGYPNVPPHVHYHSGGLRLNPNLYNCGKVCLSLLNTWSGHKSEKWLPGVSTILQVLVSIQGLILNAKPFFNEPGYARLSGSGEGEMKSLRYNEDTFILSLKTMVYVMRRPPKNFEDFVAGHFCSRAQDILVACKAYMDGAQVGCLVKGGVQDVDQGDKSCSNQFKTSLAAYVDLLVKEFTQVGAKDCDKVFTSAIVKNPLGEMPVAATVS